MRFNEILFESVAKYRPMYSGFPDPNHSDITNFITKTESILKREDRMVWICRFHRLWYLNAVKQQQAAGKTKIQPNLDPEGKLEKKYVASFKRPEASVGQLYKEANEVMSGGILNLRHYLSLELPKIDAIVFDKQPLDDIIEQMREYEKEWQEKIKSSVQLEGDEEIVLDFHNGWVWMDLNRGYCNNEAKAMGHCGNAGNKDSDTILSLRKHIADDYWEPHLTFILNTNTGMLGEMKGKANEKPVPRYHDMIVALLRLDMIKGIKGGGYMPQNNFSIADLPLAVSEQLVDEKPALMDFSSIYAKYKKGEVPADVVEEALGEDILKSGYDYNRIDLDRGLIIITDYASIEQYCSYTWGLCSSLKRFFDSQLEDIIMKHGTDELRENVDGLVERIEEDHFETMFKEIVGYDRNFQLDGVYVRVDGDKPQVVMNINDYASLEGSEEAEYIRELDDEYEGDVDDYSHLVLDDELQDAILAFIINKGEDEASVAAEIQRVYGSEEGGFPSFTTRDPRQLRFPGI